MFVKELKDSSEITSRPPVAAMMSITPKSKRSSFFISIKYGDSFLLFGSEEEDAYPTVEF